MEGHSEMRNNNYQNRNERDNSEGAPGDDQNAGGGQLQKTMRHTPEQIKELEAVFEETPYPNGKLRSDLSNKLGLKKKSVTSWFQHRRMKFKAVMEYHENIRLREENKKLREENSVLKQAVADSTCNNCGVPIRDVAHGPCDEGENHNV